MKKLQAIFQCKEIHNITHGYIDIVNNTEWEFITNMYIDKTLLDKTHSYTSEVLEFALASKVIIFAQREILKNPSQLKGKQSYPVLSHMIELDKLINNYRMWNKDRFINTYEMDHFVNYASSIDIYSSKSKHDDAYWQKVENADSTHSLEQQGVQRCMHTMHLTYNCEKYSRSDTCMSEVSEQYTYIETHPWIESMFSTTVFNHKIEFYSIWSYICVLGDVEKSQHIYKVQCKGSCLIIPASSISPIANERVINA